MIFVNIIESVPEAMCVLDDKNQEILFSNKKFDRLQTLLNKNQ